LISIKKEENAIEMPEQVSIQEAKERLKRAKEEWKK